MAWYLMAELEPIPSQGNHVQESPIVKPQWLLIDVWETPLMDMQFKLTRRMINPTNLTETISMGKYFDDDNDDQSS